MNLPAELRLDIFERLEFDDLFRVSQVLPDDRDLIGKVFRKLLEHQAFKMVYKMIYSLGVRSRESDIRIYVGEVHVLSLIHI